MSKIMESNSSLLKSFILLRVLSVPIIQTWFVPDETWQATEVAHSIVYGYGYLTWEWHEGLRSILYPSIFAALFKILSFCRLDADILIIHGPRVLSAVLFAFGDFYFQKTFSLLYGRGSNGWVAVSLFTSWFLSYCCPRTLTSSIEMTILAVVLYNFPWKKEKDSTDVGYLWWGGIGCMIRPTFALLLLHYSIKHILLCRKKSKLLVKYFITICTILMLSVIIDSLYYGEIKIVFWNFLKFNALSGLSAHYGTHSWHWYLTQGLPVTLGIHLVPLCLALCKRFSKYSSIIIPCLWTIFAHSFLGHKEFRFLLPIVPLLLGVAGDYIHWYIQETVSVQGNDRMHKSVIILLLLVIPNVCVLFYMGCIHQRGPIDCISSLKMLLQNDDSPKVLFLTPCHSTPLYSHLHRNVSIRFLTCEPNINELDGYNDEADVFFANPLQWIEKEYGVTKADQQATHVIMYDSLAITLEPFLQLYSYELCSQIFNAHFYEGKRSKYLLIFCKTSL